MFAFFNRLFRKQKVFGFLAQLTDAQKVEVSNLDPMVYDAVIQEKTHKDAPEVLIPSAPHLVYMLRKLDIPELERLAEAIRQSRKGDDLASANAAHGASQYLEATKINPFLDIAFMSYGCTIANQGNLREGIKWVEKALAINPNNDRARRNLQGMKSML